MKTLAILIIGSFLSGCAMTPAPTLEQLEIEAMLTGDWSAVERHERAEKRRLARQPLQCPPNYINYCVTFSKEGCSCVSRAAVFDALN